MNEDIVFAILTCAIQIAKAVNEENKDDKKK